MKQSLVKFAYATLAAFILGTLYPGAALAGPGLTCLLTAEGKTLQWDSRWQRDGEDNNVNYTVLRTNDASSGGRKIITLRLTSQTKATNQARFIAVGDERIARQMCKRVDALASVDSKKFANQTPKKTSPKLRPGRINTPRLPLRLPEINTKKDKEKEEQKKNADAFSSLPYITYTSKGWVRAETPIAETLTACYAFKRKFSCKREEKERFGGQLKVLEEEGRALAALRK